MSKPIVLSAPAKLNLFLHVQNRRLDGYHNLQTVFQLVDWCDFLYFAQSPQKDNQEIAFYSNQPELAHSENLVVQAAKLLRDYSGSTAGAEIFLDKRLPIGGGVGGGSSDAAATLVGLNRLWKTGVSQKVLLELAAQLGADVPVFVLGFTAWAEGIGERLHPLVLRQRFYVLACPLFSIATQSIFQDSRLSAKKGRMTGFLDFSVDSAALSNDFEPIVCSDYPEIQVVLVWLRQFARASITGTGGCVFAAFDTREEAGKIASLNPFGDVQMQVVTGVHRSPLYTE